MKNYVVQSFGMSEPYMHKGIASCGLLQYVVNALNQKNEELRSILPQISETGFVASCW